jgi:hypothetical protein
MKGEVLTEQRFKVWVWLLHKSGKEMYDGLKENYKFTDRFDIY